MGCQVSYNVSVHKLMLYADDILLFVSDTPNTPDPFSKLSGYKINWTKSEALPLTWFHPTTIYQAGSFRWPKQGLQYLGIIFPPKTDNTVKGKFVLQWFDKGVLTLGSVMLSRWFPSPGPTTGGGVGEKSWWLLVKGVRYPNFIKRYCPMGKIKLWQLCLCWGKGFGCIIWWR